MVHAIADETQNTSKLKQQGKEAGKFMKQHEVPGCWFLLCKGILTTFFHDLCCLIISNTSFASSVEFAEKFFPVPKVLFLVKILA